MTGPLPRSAFAPVVLALLAGAGAAGAVLAPRPYSMGPPVAHTGGFGEPTCLECHADGPAETARVVLEAPEAYEPGGRYTLVVRIEKDGLRRGGFQLAVRFHGGQGAGRQAGRLEPLDGRVRITPDTVTGVLYASHTADGTAAAATGVASWTLAWTAPAGGGGVDIHLAANASNDDFSEFGDVIVTASRRIAARKR